MLQRTIAMVTFAASFSWRDEFVTAEPLIGHGEMVLPRRPGWGIDINEAAVRARPPRT
jgi:L-alanine-DL-glutamate epimerase-like enolase superfamily enzyme